MKIFITIDTEEDDWSNYRPTGHSLENIKGIPYLQDLFDKFGARPTYLITYPVAADMRAAALLRAIMDEGLCEIGTHCHPWNTPPFAEEITSRNSMLCNLPADLQYEKLSNLHNTICKNFGSRPVSFRAGRWGYSCDVARNLCSLGYRIDTSITPYTDWTGYHGPDFSGIQPGSYRFSCGDILRRSPEGEMVEIPATIGFLQQNFALCNSILKAARRSPIRYLRPAGLLYRLRLINKVWLSPEASDGRNMIKLIRRMMKNGYPFVNLVFHSSSLKAGLTPFVRTEHDKERFFRSIREVLAFARDAGIESVKLSEGISSL